jgi:hypothetical protein
MCFVFANLCVILNNIWITIIQIGYNLLTFCNTQNFQTSIFFCMHDWLEDTCTQASTHSSFNNSHTLFAKKNPHTQSTQRIERNTVHIGRSPRRTGEGLIDVGLKFFETCVRGIGESERVAGKWIIPDSGSSSRLAAELGMVIALLFAASGAAFAGRASWAEDKLQRWSRASSRAGHRSACHLQRRWAAERDQYAAAEEEMGGGGEGRWRTGLVCISGGEGRQRTVGDELRRWGTRRVCGFSPLESGLVARGRKCRCRFCFNCFLPCVVE